MEHEIDAHSVQLPNALGGMLQTPGTWSRNAPCASQPAFAMLQPTHGAAAWPATAGPSCYAPRLDPLHVP